MTERMCPRCGAANPPAGMNCVACGERFPQKVDRKTWPILVRLSLWGLPSRASAWAFVWICVAGMLGSLAYGFVDWWFFPIAGLFVPAALAYYLSLRWVDENSSWR
ncbi:MAG: hypothetical protein HY290_04070 [Planctomycetia bacterium]|nr:hypothetical protein [Planctomycetia bacterium]